MSHFTSLKTRFQNLFYLEKALNKLDITHAREKQLVPYEGSKIYNTNLKITQSNNSDITFVWNGEEYELVVDVSFWTQSTPVETFIEKIAQQYAGEVIIGESQKMGFQPITYKQNHDGSNTLVLERWNQK